jgi:hypothetical protein
MRLLILSLFLIAAVLLGEIPAASAQSATSYPCHPLASVATLVLDLRCSWGAGSAPMPKCWACMRCRRRCGPQRPTCDRASADHGTVSRRRNYLVMPRYFFHLEGGDRIADKRGLDLPDDIAARHEAEKIATALRRARGPVWRVTVTNEAGHEVTEIPAPLDAYDANYLIDNKVG